MLQLITYLFPRYDNIIINSNIWNIKGNVFTDSSNNCLLDSSEIFHSNIKLNLFSNANLLQQTFTDQGGRYTFAIDTGVFDYSIDTSGLPIEIVLSCPWSI